MEVARLGIDEAEEQHALRNLVRSVLEREVTPQRLNDFDEREVFDEELYRSLAETGLVGLGADVDGSRAEHLSQTVVLEELGAGATSLGVCFVVQYMGVSLLGQYGTKEQKQSVMVPLLEGDARIAFGLTEPDGGTDVARAMRSLAKHESDGSFRLSGRKLWISGALGAKTLIVFARTAPIEGSAINGITIFLVPQDSPGVTVREVKTIGVHGLDTCEITFDDVLLPATSVLGEVGQGFRQVLGTLNAERLNGAAMALGIARGAHEHTLTYVKQREAFGRPIGAFQVLQHRLVDGAIQLEATRGLLQRAAKAADAGSGGETLSAMVNIMASDAATSITDAGMRALAGAGYSREFPVQRYFRDCRLYTFAPLTDEMLRNFVGENFLGLPRSY